MRPAGLAPRGPGDDFLGGLLLFLFLSGPFLLYLVLMLGA